MVTTNLSNILEDTHINEYAPKLSDTYEIDEIVVLRILEHYGKWLQYKISNLSAECGEFDSKLTKYVLFMSEEGISIEFKLLYLDGSNNSINPLPISKFLKRNDNEYKLMEVSISKGMGAPFTLNPDYISSANSKRFWRIYKIWDKRIRRSIKNDVNDIMYSSPRI